MTITTRFAPSPTGRLHVGNIRVALLNWLLARQGGGRYILRIDDTDAERSREAFVDAIRRDLEWLGLEWDEEHRQSERFARYEAVFDALVGAGRIYPAYETPQELDLKRKVRRSRGLPPIYDRAALGLGEQDRRRLEADGVRPHWRFKLDHDESITWEDGVRGAQAFDPKLLSDPVVRRADGTWLYLLPSVIDDHDMKVTDVLRGEDHVSNTAVQLQMFTALHAAEGTVQHLPRFAHVALLTGRDGKLSKRLGAMGCDTFREDGVEPQAILSLLATLGTSQPVAMAGSLAELVDRFELASFGRAPARFDGDDLLRLNAQVVHSLPYDAVADRLPAGMTAQAWDAIRPNLATVAEAAGWWQTVVGPLAPQRLPAEDAAYCALAADRIEWGEAPWASLTARLSAETGRRGKALFQPLRLALTGRAQGPDMAALLSLIGEDAARARLRAVNSD